LIHGRNPAPKPFCEHVAAVSKVFSVQEDPRRDRKASPSSGYEQLLECEPPSF
jgi:hypothetical protein